LPVNDTKKSGGESKNSISRIQSTDACFGLRRLSISKKAAQKKLRLKRSNRMRCLKWCRSLILSDSSILPTVCGLCKLRQFEPEIILLSVG
jgi:hypothetical protein